MIMAILAKAPKQIARKEKKKRRNQEIQKR